jgi:ATP-dependent protease ClpP protease subunit
MNKKLDYEEDDSFLEMIGVGGKTKISRSVVQTEHYYPLTYEIESFEQVAELIELLLSVPPTDVIRIFISTNGGRLDVSEQVVAAIHEARERGVIVIAQLGFNVCSAGTFIALSCSDLIVSPTTTFMIHLWVSGVSYGNTTHQMRDIAFSHDQSTKFMTETYGEFLTPEELSDILEHPKDLWFNGEQVLERWANMQMVDEDEEVGSMTLDDLIDQRIEAALAAKAEVVKKPTPAKKPVKKVPETKK